MSGRAALVGVVMLAAAHATGAAVSDFYFYPAGQSPADLPALSATSTNIAVTAWHDAQVHSAYPATAFGADESALACATGVATAHVFFACTDIYVHLSGPVQSARLFLYTYGAASLLPWLSVGVARVTTAWHEDTVTWATQPAQAAATYLNGAGDQLDASLAIDVQSVVEAERQLAPEQRHGFAVRDLAGSTPLWFTQESAVAAYRPYLHVFVPEPGTTAVLLVILFCHAARRRNITHLRTI